MSTKLDVALAADPIVWDDVIRLCKRLKALNRISEYLCSIVSNPESPVKVLQALMHVCQKMSQRKIRSGLHDTLKLPRVISFIWTRILTGHAYSSRDRGHRTFDLLPEWQDFLKGTTTTMPNIEAVVLAMEKTVTLIRMYPREMATAVLPGTELRRQLPLLHFLVYHNVPPFLVWIAAKLYPADVHRRDFLGNLPLQYATLSSSEWQDWRSRRSDHQDASPQIAYSELPIPALQEKFHTNLQILTHISSSTDCEVSRDNMTALATYLWSFLDFWPASQDHLTPQTPGDEQQRANLRTSWNTSNDKHLYVTNFWDKDLQSLLKWAPEALLQKDPTLGCFPFLQPSLVRWMRLQSEKPQEEESTTQEPERVLPWRKKTNKSDHWSDLDKVFLSLTYTLLRSNPAVLEHAILPPRPLSEKEHESRYVELLNPYERVLYQRWKMEVRQEKRLQAKNAALRSRLAALREGNRRLNLKRGRQQTS